MEAMTSTRFRALRLTLARMMAASLLLLVTPAFAGGCVGDVNGDAKVDGADLAVLLGSWGGTGPADLNGDGLTDGADLAILLGAWGPCPAGCTAFVPMTFTNEIVMVAAGSASLPVTLNGFVNVFPDGLADGSVAATLPDGSVASIQLHPGIVQVLLPGLLFDLVPLGPPLIVMVNGILTPTPAVLDQFYLDAGAGTPVNLWAATSQASLALAALTSTTQWECNVQAAQVPPGGVASQGFWCKAAAYGAATIIAGLAAAGCAALTAGCAVGTAVTIGGVSVPCVVLIGLCAGGAFAGTAAAYEAVLALWGNE